jgi:hypothetical protein
MSKKSITLSQACEGMIRYKKATGKSENTIADYSVTFKKLFYYFESDPPINTITKGDMIEFLPGFRRSISLNRMASHRGENSNFPRKPY